MDIELIIHTSDSDALDQLRSAVAELRQEGHLVHGRVTFEAGDAAKFAREATLRGADMILAAGGDGTLNEVVNGMFTAGRRGRAETLPRMGIVPLGTANDLAGWLDIPVGIPDAVKVAIAQKPKIIDVARVNERYFLNVSTGGFGAEATEEASDKAKRALGTFAYVVTGVRKFAALQPCHARFTSHGEEVFNGEFLLFAVGNGCKTGGGNYLTPRAKLSDQALDLAIVRAISHAEFLRLMPQLRSGAHVDSEHVIYRQIPHLLVEPSKPLSVNADGEPLSSDVFEYSVVPSALRLSVPPSFPT